MKLELLNAVDWYVGAKYKEIASLIVHPLLSKIAQGMLAHTLEKEYPKFVLFATHDTTIAPLLIEMGIFQNHWPAYASRIVFELWEAGGLLGSKLTGQDHESYFVRVLHDGRDYTTRLNCCKNKLKFGKLCPLLAFIKFLKGSSGSMDVEYSRMCSTLV